MQINISVTTAEEKRANDEKERLLQTSSGFTDKFKNITSTKYPHFGNNTRYHSSFLT